MKTFVTLLVIVMTLTAAHAQTITKEFPVASNVNLSVGSQVATMVGEALGVAEVMVVVTGTWVGTIFIEGAADTLTFTTLATITVNGTYAVPSTGSRTVRVRTDTVWTSGVAVVQVRPSVATPPPATSYTTVRLTDGTSFVTAGAAAQATQDSAAINTGSQIMARASNALATLTAVSDGDAVRPAADLGGRLINLVGCPIEDIVTGVDVDTDGSSTAIIAAQGANIRTVIYSITVSNTNLLGLFASVDLRDGVAGAVKLTTAAPALNGQSIPLTVPIPFSANTAVAADPSAAVGTITTTVVGCRIRG